MAKSVSDYEHNVDKDGHTDVKIFALLKKIRKKLKYSCCLWFAFFMSGWILKQLGPVLMDIQQITGVSFTVASTYATAFQFGKAIGCPLSGYVQEKVHSSMLLCFTFVGSAILVMWLPWSTNVVETLVVHFLMGMCLGFIDPIVIAELSAVWGISVSVPVQIAYSCFSVGGGIAALVTAPFLKKTIENHVYTTPTTVNSAIENEHKFHSKIYIPFSFTATLNVVAGALFVVVFFKKKNGDGTEYVDIKERSSGKMRTITQRAIALAIFSVLMSLSSSIVFNASYFLTPFLVKLSICSRSEAASITSLFTASQAIGRITGIVTVQFVDHFALLLGHSAICIVGLIGIWNSVVYKSSLFMLCFSVATAGFGFSVMCASLRGWVEKRFLPITGLVSSYFFTIDVLGESISTLGIGYCIDKYSPFSFLYIIFGQVVTFIVFLFIVNGFRITVSSY